MGRSVRHDGHHQWERLETLYGPLPHGIAVLDSDCRLVYANEPWRSFLAAAGTGGSDAPGTSLESLLPAAGEVHASARQSLSEARANSLPGFPCDSDDARSYWDITFSPLKQGAALAGLVISVDDVTERVVAQQAAASRARLAMFRADVSEALASSDDVDLVLQSCAEAMVRNVPAAFARIWVLDETEPSYRLRASAGLYTRLDGTYSRIPADWIREDAFPVYQPGMERNVDRTHRVREPGWAAEQGLVAWINYPLAVRGEIIGFMVMFGRQNFEEDMLGELSSVADAIAQFLERKHAEASLRERETLFRRIFESAADGVIIYDVDTGQILEANPTMSGMHGYTPEEFLRIDRAQLVHPDSHGEMRRAMDRIRSGQVSRAHLLHVRKDGSIFSVQTQGTPIMLAGQHAVLSVIRDMTQEQAAQAELERRVAERTQELSLLLDISGNVASTLELGPLLELILEQLRSVIDYTGAAILTMEGDDLVIAGQLGPLSNEDVTRIRHPVAALAPVWDRLSRGEAILIHDTRGDAEEAEVFRAVSGEELDLGYGFIRSCLWVPLVVKDELIGFMSIAGNEPGAFGREQIALASAIARQAAVAIENARLYEQAGMVAVLEERQRLARELHDAVTQTLFSASLIGDALPTLWTRDPERGESALEDLRVLTRGALAEMRSLLFELRPAALVEAPLQDLLRHLGDATAGQTRLPIVVTVRDVPALPPDVQIAFYRIAQEALNNVSRHARATRVELHVTGMNRPLRMHVRDDGRGFVPRSDGPAGHFGLQTMAERATAIGGDLEIHSEPGQGTEVTVTWPAEPTIEEET